MELLAALKSLLASCFHAPSLFLFFVTFILLVDFMKRRKGGSSYPPGPPSWPFVGNMLQVDFRNLPTSFDKFQKKFGNVLSFQMGWINLVVVNGYDAVKEALVTKSEDTADRPPMPLLENLGFRKDCEGVVMARYGRGWKDIRRFTISTLRNFGLGKKSLEERVSQEATCLCAAFETQDGCPFDPHFLINNAVSNVICSIVFGDRFEYDDEKFQRMLHVLDESLETGQGLLPQVLSLFPVLLRIPFLERKVFRPQREIFSFMREIIKEHQETFDPAMTRDFIDAFLVEMEKTKDNPSDIFCLDNLLFTVGDLFGAGTETTSTSLRWGLLYMILYPDIQSQVHKEIDTVIGRGRKPTMEDQINLPFTNAVIHEIQRCGDIVPLSLPHMTCRDTEIQGFVIPKGVGIFTNLTSVLKDETVWERPHQFYPEHFLDAEKNFVKRDAFMPFSAGRRVCLGEQLARMELFLFFTTLFQRFTFTIPKNQARPREDPVYIFTHSPHSYQICAELR
ncbi:cytochrome P450 2D17-like isoform X2 [Lissotriton helveticus]